MSAQGSGRSPSGPGSRPSDRAQEVAALRASIPNAVPVELVADLSEAVAALLRLLLPVEMTLAQAAMCDEPTADDAVLFSFMGSGASDQVTVGEYRAAVALADGAVRAATEACGERP